MENTKVLVSGDDIRCASRHGEFQDLVIAWIAAICDLFVRLDQKGPFDEAFEEVVAISGRKVPLELLPPQDLADFLDRWKRQEDLAGPKGEPQSSCGSRVLEEEGADKHVHIEDESRLSSRHREWIPESPA
jgi:hypothetical protein